MFIKPDPLEIPAITNLSLKTFEAPTQQKLKLKEMVHINGYEHGNITMKGFKKSIF